jgi:hypothetical protein
MQLAASRTTYFSIHGVGVNDFAYDLKESRVLMRVSSIERANGMTKERLETDRVGLYLCSKQ